MPSEARLALTLALSPRRGNQQWGTLGRSLNGEHSPALENILPPHEPQGRARHSVRAAFVVEQSRRARSDAPYHCRQVQRFNARGQPSENSLPGGEGRGEGESEFPTESIYRAIFFIL